MDVIAGAPNRMPQTEGFLLARVGNLPRFRNPFRDRRQGVLLAAFFQRAFQFGGVVEMILDRRFGAARHEDEFLDAGLARFIDRVLDQRAVDNGQHFLGHGFGRRQETGALPGNGKYGFSDGFNHWVRSIIKQFGQGITPHLRRLCAMGRTAMQGRVVYAECVR